MSRADWSSLAKSGWVGVVLFLAGWPLFAKADPSQKFDAVAEGRKTLAKLKAYEKAAAERAAVERAADEKAAAERAADEKVAAEREATRRAAYEKVAAEREATRRAAYEKVIAEREAARKAHAQKMAEWAAELEKKRAERVAEFEKARAQRMAEKAAKAMEEKVAAAKAMEMAAAAKAAAEKAKQAERVKLNKIDYSDVYVIDLIEDFSQSGWTVHDQTEIKYLDLAAKSGKPIRVHRIGPKEMASFLKGEDIFRSHTAQGPSKVFITGHGCPGCNYITNRADSNNTPLGKRYSVDQLASAVHTLVPRQQGSKPVKISLGACSGGLGRPGQQGAYEQSLAHSLGAKLASEYKMGSQISGRMGLVGFIDYPLFDKSERDKRKAQFRQLASAGKLPRKIEHRQENGRHFELPGLDEPLLRKRTQLPNGNYVVGKQVPTSKVAVHTSPEGEQKTLFPTAGESHAELRMTPHTPEKLDAMRATYANAQGVNPALIRSEKEKEVERAAAKKAEAERFRAERAKRKKVDYSDVYLVDVRENQDPKWFTAHDRLELKYLDQAAKTGKPVRVHRIGPKEMTRFLNGDKDIFRGQTAKGPSKVIIEGIGCPGCDFISSDSSRGKRYEVDQLARLVHELVPSQKKNEAVKISLRSSAGGLGRKSWQGIHEQSLAHSLGAKLSSEYKMESQISGRTGAIVSYDSILTVQDQEVRRNLRSLASAGDLPATGIGPHGVMGFADPSLRPKTLMQDGRMVTAKQDPAAKVTIHTSPESGQKTLSPIAVQSPVELKKDQPGAEAEKAKAKVAAEEAAAKKAKAEQIQAEEAAAKKALAEEEAKAKKAAAEKAKAEAFAAQAKLEKDLATKAAAEKEAAEKATKEGAARAAETKRTQSTKIAQPVPPASTPLKSGSVHSAKILRQSQGKQAQKEDAARNAKEDAAEKARAKASAAQAKEQRALAKNVEKAAKKLKAEQAAAEKEAKAKAAVAEKARAKASAAQAKEQRNLAKSAEKAAKEDKARKLKAEKLAKKAAAREKDATAKEIEAAQARSEAETAQAKAKASSTQAKKRREPPPRPPLPKNYLVPPPMGSFRRPPH